MEVIKREGSLVWIKTKEGELWLTHRRKFKRDSRRRVKKYKSIHHIPIRRIPQKGDWLFTCSMLPLQFNEWQDEDGFTTLEGSHHSKKHCSLNLVTTKYAEFFNNYRLWELYHIHNDNFEAYEKAVKEVCKAFKIKFEGI